MRKRIQCPFCFETFSIEVFAEEGESQELIYDCEVCCHPLEIKLALDHETGRFTVEVDKSTGF